MSRGEAEETAISSTTVVTWFVRQESASILPRMEISALATTHEALPFGKQSLCLRRQPECDWQGEMSGQSNTCLLSVLANPACHVLITRATGDEAAEILRIDPTGSEELLIHGAVELKIASGAGKARAAFIQRPRSQRKAAEFFVGRTRLFAA